MGSIKKAFDLSGRVGAGHRRVSRAWSADRGSPAEPGAKILSSLRKAADLEQAQKHLAGLRIKANWIAANN